MSKHNQRRKVEALTDRSGQRQQADKVRRNHQRGCDAVPLDGPQRVRGIEMIQDDHWRTDEKEAN